MIRIRAADLARLCGWAEQAYPREACALLVGRARPGAVIDLTRLERSRNLAPQPELAFEIDPGLRMGVERELRQDRQEAGPEPAERLVGLWHSHPDGPALPSARDRDAVQEDLAWLLTAVARGRAVQTRAFRPVPAPPGRGAGRGAGGGSGRWTLGDRTGGWRAGGFLPERLVVTDWQMEEGEQA